VHHTTREFGRKPPLWTLRSVCQSAMLVFGLEFAMIRGVRRGTWGIAARSGDEPALHRSALVGDQGSAILRRRRHVCISEPRQSHRSGPQRAKQSVRTYHGGSGHCREGLAVRGAKGSTVKSLSFHSFRHGAASAVFRNAALKDIARRVTAHSSRGVVDRYLHQDVEAIREATALIPRLPKGQVKALADSGLTPMVEELLIARIPIRENPLPVSIPARGKPAPRDS
jgi:hypothetical protein